jgi:hypothetical protein
MLLLRTEQENNRQYPGKQNELDGCYANLVCAVGVNFVDQIPILILHVLEADITEDTSVVDENIDPAEVLDGSLNDGFTVLNAVIVGYCLAASRPDLLNYYISSLRRD